MTGGMRRIRRFVQLSGGERRMLLRVLLVVGVARASLWLLPMAKARRMVTRAAKGTAGGSVEKLVWAVETVSRCLPGTTCLPQALAAQALLTCSGFPSQVEIGVAKDEGFRAHAWLVCYGQVVLGAQPGARYNSL